VYNVVDKHLR